MIDINKFYIREDGKKIIIDVSITDKEYFENVYLKDVSIYDIDDNLLYTVNLVSNSTTQGPGNNEEPGGQALYANNSAELVKEGQKSFSTVIDRDDLINRTKIDATIFYLKVTSYGAPSPETPCGEDVDEVKAYTYYKGTLYNMMLNFLKELNVNCTIPQGFIDAMLKFKGVDVALNTGNPELAKDLWNRIINNTTNSVVSSNCGCHG